jgi:exodeoxyribonuclease VII small subunit
MNAKNDEDAEILGFEQALGRLESVVRALESSETGLDQSLVKYEEGVRLLKHCRGVLDETERKIRLLTGVDADGNPITTEFDATATADRAEPTREPAAKPKRNTVRAARQTVEAPPENGERLF